MSIDIAASHQKRLGCSNIAQAMGLSRWGTAYQLWERYTGRAAAPDIGNELRVALGTPMEDVLRPFIEQRLGKKLRRDRKEYLHPSLPLVGNLDFRVEAEKNEPRPVLDTKTSLGFGARARFGEDGTDEVDVDVLMQVQGYCLLTGATLAYVAALVPGPELKIYTLPADPELHALVEEGVARFWWHVKTDTPPAITTLPDAARRWPTETLDAIPADEGTLNLLASYRQIKADLKALEAQADAYELTLKERLAEHEAFLGPDGKPLCVWKSQQSTRLDTARIKSEAPDLYAEYSKTTTSRIFRLSKLKD